MDYGVETIKRQAETCACGCLAVRLARVCGPVLQPTGCTSAMAFVVPAPLKSRCVAWGAIQVVAYMPSPLQSLRNSYACPSSVSLRMSMVNARCTSSNSAWRRRRRRLLRRRVPTLNELTAWQSWLSSWKRNSRAVLTRAGPTGSEYGPPEVGSREVWQHRRSWWTSDPFVRLVCTHIASSSCLFDHCDGSNATSMFFYTCLRPG